MNNKRKIKKLVFLALCLSMALVLSYVEAIIPMNLGVPGAKLGLPNIMTLLLIYTVGPAEALAVSLMRIVLSGFLFGNLFAILYSGAGFLLSFAAMLLLKKTGIFGMTGVSVVGGIMHNIGQILIAAILTNAGVFAYLPVLIAAGTIAGILIGLVGGIFVGRVLGFIKIHL
ncbi:MAG: Gx transporter family protein [Eubacteriales bacterium]|nr:Gx transporter family protein [Eubacteriales bacterium]